MALVKSINIKGIEFKEHVIKEVVINFIQKKTTIFVDSFLNNLHEGFSNDTTITVNEVLQDVNFEEFLTRTNDLQIIDNCMLFEAVILTDFS